MLVNIAPPGASHQAASLPIPRGEEASRGLMVGILSQFSQSVTILDSLWVFTAQLLRLRPRPGGAQQGREQVQLDDGGSSSAIMQEGSTVPFYKKENSAVIKKESSADPQSPMARSWQRQRWLMAASPRSWSQMGAGACHRWVVVVVRNPSHLAIGHHRTFFTHLRLCDRCRG